MNSLVHANRLQDAGLSGQQGRARHGIVTAVDPASHSVKITIQPENVVSGWLPDAGLACAGLRICCPSEIGTQVLVVPVEGDAEHPVIVARVFDTIMSPPISPVTGKPVQPGEIGFFLANGNYLHLLENGIAIKGDVSIEGTVRVTEDVLVQAVSAVDHVHGGVAAGSATTTAPAR